MSIVAGGRPVQEALSARADDTWRWATSLNGLAVAEAYRERPKVERKIAELVKHGLRRARYVGRKKKRLQALWTAAVVNLKRLFKLFGGDVQKARAALLAVQHA